MQSGVGGGVSSPYDMQESVGSGFLVLLLVFGFGFLISFLVGIYAPCHMKACE